MRDETRKDQEQKDQLTDKDLEKASGGYERDRTTTELRTERKI